MKGKIVSVISTKGSVGKTSLVIHISGYLASIGKRVLLIDADSQQSLSKFFDYKGMDMDIPYKGFGMWLTSDCNADEVIRKTANSDNIDVILNDDPNKLRVASFLRNNAGAIFKLAMLVKPLQERYDYIFLDTEGTDGRDHDGNSIQNAVLLANPDLVLSVTKTKLQFAMEAMRVVDVYRDALKSYAYIGLERNPPLKFIINEHDRSLNMSGEILNDLRTAFADGAITNVSLLDTVVPLKRAFFESYYTQKQFAHEYKDNNQYDHLNVVIAKLCQEIFPEIVSSNNDTKSTVLTESVRG
ncbi:MAG: ParA family protein [Cardiobacteriaceae bacterium]|nr:ParA family protein [Cardiobacteriaceae bacterium]